MFEHRVKRIGKSTYSIRSHGSTYWVEESYGSVTARSRYIHRNIDDALTELEQIRVEGYYTDPSGSLKY